MEYSFNGSELGVRGIIERLGVERGHRYLAQVESREAIADRTESDIVMAMIDLAHEDATDDDGDDGVELYDAPELLDVLRDRVGRRNSALLDVAEGTAYALEQLRLQGH